jgi:predicted alpha-1,6-mannanase (GH76 family)
MGDSDVPISVSWWNCANTLEAVANYALTCNDDSFNDVINYTWNMTAAQFPHRCATEDSYDDVLWWSLAWMRAGQAVNRLEEFTVRSECYFELDVNEWSSVCDGGIWWSMNRDYKVSQPNTLCHSFSCD